MRCVRKRRWLAACLSIVAALTVSACGNSSSSSGGGGNGDSSLVISRSIDPHSLDPAQEVSVGGGLESFTPSYERLVNLTPEGKVVPGLATSWKTSGDGKTWTLKLRPGVTFHDGSPLTAQEIRYTWQRIVALKSPAAQYWQSVADVQPVDDLTVRFKLKHVDPTFLATLGGQRGIYIGPNRRCVEQHEKKPGDWAVDYLADHECGTGPYTVVSWQHDQQLEYAAYPRYWRGWTGPHVRRVIQKITKEPSTVRLMLESGQLDLAADPLPATVARALSANKDIKVQVSPTTTIDQFTFNVDRKPTSDPRVRQAIAYAFNYDDAIRQVYGTWAKRVHAAIPETVWPAVPADAPRYDYDPGKAKQLLAEAGYPDGLTITIAGMNELPWRDLIVALQSDLAKVGITLKTDLTTWNVLVTKLGAPKGKKPFDMAAYQMWAAIPDPSDILNWWNTDAISIVNPGWGTPATDRALDDALKTLDRGKRTRLYQDVIAQMNEDVPGIWVDQPSDYTVMRKNVQGFEYVPYYNGLVNFYDLHKTD